MESGPSKKRRRHKGSRRDRHRSAGRSGRGGDRSQSSRSSGSKEVRPTSSFAKLPPSSAPVTLGEKKQPPPVWRGFLFGLAGVLLLILLGGGQHWAALSWSLLLPGAALLYRPPRESPGVWLDRFALGLLAVLLLAFLPRFYWPSPDWRLTAVGEFQIDLPAILTVQPLLSFEAWLSVLAGLAWFYIATSWDINHTGRRWFYFVLSLVLGILAVVIFWGNQIGAHYPGAGTAGVFSFFPDPQHTANFLAVGGVVAFGYFMSGVGTRKLLPLVGFFTVTLCFLALGWGVSRSGAVLLFVGLVIWYGLQLRYGRLPKWIKIGFPFFILATSLFVLTQGSTADRLIGFTASTEQGASYRGGSVAKDTLAMIQEAPLAGHGLGNFSAIFPQYRFHSAGPGEVVHPESDLLWFSAEAGLLGLLLLGGFLLAYFARCSGFHRGPGGISRLVALAGLLIFILHALIGVPGHQPGTVYFAILLAALALPRSEPKRPSLSPKLWRICGGFLVVCGLGWGLAGLTGLPLHSNVALAQYKAAAKQGNFADNRGNASSALDQWIDLHPLNWRPYFQRATLALSTSGDLERAAGDFRRARFLEPTRGSLPLEEGLAWIPHDPARALLAWREVFSRELEDKEAAYRRLLHAAEQQSELIDGLSELSKLDLDFRVRVLTFLSGEKLMRELQSELKTDPLLSRYSRSQRSAIVETWIRQGDRVAAEEFLRANESSLNRPWWLWSLARQTRAEFEEAVNFIRRAIAPPDMPGFAMKGESLDRLQRGFSVAPGDIMQGTALLQRYLEQENFQKVRDVTQALISAREKVPPYVTYWNAESYFQLRDYIESWYVYETYLKQLWDDPEVENDF